MDNLIFKTIFICMISAFLILTIKIAMPSFVPVLLLTGGIVCFFISVPYIENLIELIRSISQKIYGVEKYIAVTVKIVGIALICEFASQMCSDMGENYLSSKIDFAGKIIIVSMCAPEFLNLVNTVIDMIGSI